MRKDKHRERWMQNFDARVREAMPELSGKINWDAAIYFYSKGMVSDEAAQKYVETEGSK